MLPNEQSAETADFLHAKAHEVDCLSEERWSRTTRTCNAGAQLIQNLRLPSLSL